MISKKISALMVSSLLLLGSSVVMAGDAPSIGAGASLSVSVGEAGIINAGGAASGGHVNAKQEIGSVLSGQIGSSLNMNVSVGKAGVINVGGAASGGHVNACQAVGTIGDNCGEGS